MKTPSGTTGAPLRRQALKRIPLPEGLFALVDDEIYEQYGRLKWAINSRGYVFRRERLTPGKWITVRLHRLAAGANEGEDVHHVNGDLRDNRRVNLIRVSRSLHTVHINTLQGPLTGRFKGVSWDKNRRKWMAWIQVDRKRRFLGRFTSEEEAARAYDAEASLAFGPHAYLNLPPPPAPPAGSSGRIGLASRR
jgi:hypothetical protein